MSDAEHINDSLKRDDETSQEGGGQTALTFSSLRRRFLSVRNVVAIAIASSLLFFLIVQFDLDLESTWLEIKRTNPVLYVAAFAIYYLSFPVRSIRWRVLLEDSGCEDINAQDKISILTLSEIGFLGWFLNSVSVFRMGFIYRCYQLSSRLKAGLALVAGSLFAERILDTVVTLGLLSFAALFLLSSYWNPVLTYILLGGVVLTLVLAGVPIAMVVSGRSLTRFLPAKFRGGYDNFREGTIKSFRRWPRLTVLSIAVWGLETARLLLVIYSLGLDVDISIVVFVALGASIITTFPITPGGLGSGRGRYDQRARHCPLCRRGPLRHPARPLDKFPQRHSARRHSASGPEWILPTPTHDLSSPDSPRFRPCCRPPLYYNGGRGTHRPSHLLGGLHYEEGSFRRLGRDDPLRK